MFEYKFIYFFFVTLNRIINLSGSLNFCYTSMLRTLVAYFKTKNYTFHNPVHKSLNLSTDTSC